jgi:GNAT superfamily N-acetyltransferase
VQIRRAGASDAEAIADVFIPSFESLSFLPQIHTHDETRGHIRRVVAAEEVWVAENEGQILGFAALTADMLSHLYVHPDAQGRGAGSALMDRAEERRPGGFTFWVFQENDQARRFYEARGCRVLELTDGSGNEEKTPDALYEWRRDR